MSIDPESFIYGVYLGSIIIIFWRVSKGLILLRPVKGDKDIRHWHGGDMYFDFRERAARNL